MLKERIATAAALLAAFLCALFLLPTAWFAFPIAVGVAAGAYEWAALAKYGRRSRLAYSFGCATFFAALVWLAEAIDPANPWVFAVNAVAAAFWLLVVPLWMFRGYRLGTGALALTVGVIVVLPAGLAMISLHSLAPVVLLKLLVLIWIADSAAYFTGRAIGRHKLAPEISPGKTWEGAAGAFAGTLIYAIICAVATPAIGGALQGVYWVAYLGIAVLLCALSIVGDLFESLMKRQASVKDSGTLLPGHGGVLDRIDSITSTLPAATLIVSIATSVQ